MKISYKWLSELLPSPLSVNELSEILTSIGLEVEDITSTSKIPGDLKGLVIGKVITCEKHPNADKLSKTTVDVGNNTILPIVCGAPNVAQGQTVVVAVPGTTIHPKNGEPFEIKKAKIRGEVSEGMICAEDEIGLSDNHAGIIVIDQDITPGTSAAAFYNLPEADYTFEIGLTPNRMDAMSHIGVAKDVCAYLANKTNTQQTQIIPSANINFTSQLKNEFEINIAGNNSCKRYIGAVLKNITVTKSPEWLVDKLNAIGVRSINNIVDITNYVLHETGQPLHAFDANKIEGKKVIVRNANVGETFTTLDGVERKLTPNDLMICDATKPMCIAGVFGGENSGVTNETTSIFLESAWFNPQQIRVTSMHHGLRTDAAIRFEKGVDISQTAYALNRAISLMQELANATIEHEITDVYPEPLQANTVQITYQYINQLSGANYSKQKIKNILLHLCFAIENETDEALTLKVPYAKPDITLPADIVEEIMRIDGLDQIPFTGRINFAVGQQNNSSTRKQKEKLANCLTNLGCHEIFTNSISNSKYFNEEGLVKMLNNLSADLDSLRPQMLESGLQTIAFNVNRKNTDLKLFEIGKIYLHKNNQYIEQEQLCIYLTGNNLPAQWHAQAKPISIFDAKGMVNAIGQKLGVNFILEAKGESIEVKIKKQTLGFIESVANDKLKQFDIKQHVFFIQLNWAMLCAEMKNNTIKYQPVSKFQNVERDLALILNKSVSYDSIAKQIKSTNNSLLKSINLFDVFESKQLGDDKKSYAVRFVFNDAEKTLTDAEIEQSMANIIAKLKEAGAEVRQ
jgi:phenylalanyl-tRNA synthetase beta chain